MAIEAAEPIYVRSPEVHEDGRVTLRYYAPAAKEVLISSNVAVINKPMTQKQDGVWTATVGPLTDDTYSYHFLVDGAVVIDPVNRRTQSWLWMNSLVDVRTEKLALHQTQANPHGQLHVHWYDSPRLNQTRRLLVYTPPKYRENKGTYPVLYLFHGCGDDESAWSQIGQVQHLADNLLAADKSVPMVIVMPFGHDKLPQNPDFDVYDCQKNYDTVCEEFLRGVVPYVESEYRIQTNAADRAIVGLSMGGGQALRIGLTHSHDFHWIAGFSSAIEKHGLPGILKANLSLIKENQPWLWVGCGKQDFLYQENIRLNRWLLEHEIDHNFHIDEGDHNWRTWRGYLAKVLPELFK